MTRKTLRLSQGEQAIYSSKFRKWKKIVYTSYTVSFQVKNHRKKNEGAKLN